MSSPGEARELVIDKMLNHDEHRAKIIEQLAATKQLRNEALDPSLVRPLLAKIDLGEGQIIANEWDFEDGILRYYGYQDTSQLEGAE